MAVKVHPGVGVARIGDSPEFFVGPQTPFDVTAPSGGFRDSECRIKRQAALFRVYEHHADGTFTEITASATTTITWTVRVRQTTFDDPEVSITGPGEPVIVTAGGNELAELHTDDAGRLLVCPAVATINLAFFPDTRCEGYVQASVTRDGVELPPAAGSWVVIFQPDFAPGVHPDSGGAAGALLPLWPGLPATTPALPHTDQLDRGPLTFMGAWDGAAVGGAAHFVEPFRYQAAGPPGSLRHAGYPNWALDLYGIPSDLFAGCSTPGWLSGVAVAPGAHPTGLKGANWRLRGFLAQAPDTSLAYVDWCPVVTGPVEVSFHQVPQGTERAVPIQLVLKNFPEPTTVTQSVLGSANAWLDSAPWSTPVVGEYSTHSVTVWAIFRAEATTALGIHSGSFEFRFDARHTITVPFRAHVVAPVRVALGFVLDCSDSMNLPRGDATTRLAGLQEAMNVVLDVARPGSGVAVAPFSTTALEPPFHPRVLGSGDAADEEPGGARRAVRDYVGGLAADDLTAIGAGILSAQSLLSEPPVTTFEAKALIVVTDGYETAAPYISEITDRVTTPMFAVGIGPAFAPALRDIVGSMDGFITIAESLTSPARRHDLEKYLLQALAAITGETMVDPEGDLAPGAEHRMPFAVSDADMSVSLTVVSNAARKLAIAVECPNGRHFSLEELRATGRCRVTRTARVGHVELSVPFDPGDGVWELGEWALLIKNVEQAPALQALQSSVTLELPKGSVHYLATVASSTALRLRPSIRREVGQIVCETALGYDGAPLVKNANVSVDLTTPWGMVTTLSLAQVSPGLFRGTLPTARPGRYRAVFRARGSSRLGRPFQRERLMEEFFSNDDEQICRPTRKCTRLPRPSSLLCRLERQLHGWLKKHQRGPGS